MKTVAIVQSNYIPWKGYFDLIGAVDEFVLYDDMQFTRRDWRNRNLIKTPSGLQWLTIPVQVKGRYHQSIRETLVSDPDWAAQHWRSLALTYARAPYFAQVAEWLEPLYHAATQPSLTAINTHFVTALCAQLGITTAITDCARYDLDGEKSARLASICAQAGADVYISGPAARDYLDESVFAARGISVRWFDYSGYPPYPQLWGAFEHGVTLLDLLFNTGPEASRYMKFAA
jgi:hypothetical protein